MVEWLLGIMSADEEQDVAAYMSRLATASIRHASRLPTADVLWVKAQMLERWEAERRVQAPLDAIEPFQIGAGLVAAGILLFWSLPALLRVISEQGRRMRRPYERPPLASPLRTPVHQPNNLRCRVNR